MIRKLSKRELNLINHLRQVESDLANERLSQGLIGSWHGFSWYVGPGYHKNWRHKKMRGGYK